MKLKLTNTEYEQENMAAASISPLLLIQSCTGCTSQEMGRQHIQSAMNLHLHLLFGNALSVAFLITEAN